MERAVKGVCLGLLAALWVSTGCVRREIRLMSNPPGATVEMDGQPIMTERQVIDREGEVIEIIRPVPRLTPISFPFAWYGTHEFIVDKEGYLRQRRVVHMRPPWYEQVPIDFFFDNIYPFTINDIRTVSFDLKEEKSIRDAGDEQKEAIKEDLLERAAEFRNLAREKVPPPEPPPPPAEGEPVPEGE